MKGRITPTSVIAVMAVLAAIALAFWWSANMVLRWEGSEKPSDAARRDPMLAASMLLRQHGHQVQLAGSIGELTLDTLPDGTLVAAEGFGVVSPPNAAKLLAWVKRGNILITKPRSIGVGEHVDPSLVAAQADEKDSDDTDNDDEDDDKDKDQEKSAPRPANSNSDDKKAQPPARPKPASAGAGAGHQKVLPLPDLVEVDPIAAELGVRIRYADVRKTCPKDASGKAKPNCTTHDLVDTAQSLNLPETDHKLELAGGYSRLVSLTKAVQPITADDSTQALRVYKFGKGQVVMLAENLFDNDSLAQYDHGELLLALVKPNQPGQRVTIVQDYHALHWTTALWQNAPLLLISVATLLALLLWTAVRRFGPLLPAPLQERRALIEHINASGVWLWKTEGGRELLLSAAREEALAPIRRRAPALLRGTPADINQALAKACAMSVGTVDAALHQSAARQPLRFTSQIRTLQTMRNHYERH